MQISGRSNYIGLRSGSSASDFRWINLLVHTLQRYPTMDRDEMSAFHCSLQA